MELRKEVSLLGEKEDLEKGGIKRARRGIPREAKLVKNVLPVKKRYRLRSEYTTLIEERRKLALSTGVDLDEIRPFRIRKGQK